MTQVIRGCGKARDVFPALKKLADKHPGPIGELVKKSLKSQA